MSSALSTALTLLSLAPEPSEPVLVLSIRSAGRINCCWSSPAQSDSVSGSVKTNDHIFSKSFACFEMGLFFKEMRAVANTDHFLCTGGGSSGCAH
jgi:hypothetical protein